MISDKQRIHIANLARNRRGSKMNIETKMKLSNLRFRGGKPLCACGKQLSAYDAIRCKPCFSAERKGSLVKETVGYHAIHRWIRINYGSADKCENTECKGDSPYFEWSLLKGHKYERVRESFWMLCKKCHHEYDNLSANRQRKQDGTFI